MITWLPGAADVADAQLISDRHIALNLGDRTVFWDMVRHREVAALHGCRVPG